MLLLLITWREKGERKRKDENLEEEEEERTKEKDPHIDRNKIPPGEYLYTREGAGWMAYHPLFTKG